MHNVLILGIGNPLLSDDGAGIVCLAMLRRDHPAGDGVVYHEAGALDLSFVSSLTCCQRLLVVDAGRMGDEPGSVHLLEGEAMDRMLACRGRTAHEIGLADLLDLARLAGWKPPAQRALIAIEPASLAWGTRLTPAVAAAVPIAARLAMEVVKRWSHGGDSSGLAGSSPAATNRDTTQ